ncbi:MAG: phage integrase N-terminal SAM-like domain-containing protein [Bacteroidota bacterium]
MHGIFRTGSTLFKLSPKPAGKNALLAIAEINQSAFTKLQEQLQLKGYSENTIKVYSLSFAQLLYAIKDHQVDSLSYERFRAYFLYCNRELKLSEVLIHNRINAVKFYFEQVLGREKFLTDLPRPKKASQS